MNVYRPPPVVSGLSPRQCKVGREVLGWTQADLAARSGLSPATVKRFETSQAVHSSFAVALRHIFVTSGVGFLDEGVVFEGQVVRFGVLLLDQGAP